MFKKERLVKEVRSSFSPSYTMGLYDSSILGMYSLTPDLVEQLHVISDKKKNPFDLAKGVYDLLQNEITYGAEKKTSGYASAKEVWRNKEGICGEMAYLYVAATRYVGLRSSYVSVTVDNQGEAVHHACAAVWIPNQCLVDIAYNSFGITHQTFSLVSDREVMRNFLRWRSTDV